MSITAPDDRISTYNPVSATTTFLAGFPVFDNSDIDVFVNDVQRTDFTVTATYSEGISSDARVVFGLGITGTVHVVGARSPHRSNRFQIGAPLPISAQNLALDTLEGELQEIAREARRAHKAPFGSDGLVLTPDAIEGAQAAGESAHVDALAAAASAAASAASAVASEASANDSQAYAGDAQDLVEAASSGFVGYQNGLAYDFGYITDSTTYFDFDWGSIADPVTP